MEDLYAVGRDTVKNVNTLKTTDVGDLVLSIGEIIKELRDKPESYKERLDYLEGMFREFAYGEKYERPDPLKEEYEWNGMFGGGVALSGVMPMPIAVSGMCYPQPLNSSMSSSISSNPCGEVKLPENIASPSFDDDADYNYEEDDEIVEKEPKEFVKRWWNTQQVEEIPQEQLDD